MAVLSVPVRLEQHTCAECPRTRTVAVELIGTEHKVVDGELRVVVRPRHTVLDGCARCGGSSVIL
jgi:hypothetical protein